MAQHIGVVFCGGCNPHYDRVGFISSVTAQAEGQLFIENNRSGRTYDVVLVVCGCSCACVTAEYLNAGKIIFVTPAEVSKPGFETELVSILLHA